MQEELNHHSLNRVSIGRFTSTKSYLEVPTLDGSKPNPLICIIRCVSSVAATYAHYD